MNWNKLENIIDDPIPQCVKTILTVCGYDSFTSIQHISAERICEMEKFVNKNFRVAIQELNCCHSNTYKNMNQFEFLPGHKTFILASAKRVGKWQECFEKTKQSKEFSFIMEKLKETADYNAMRDKYHAKYCDAIRFFATYVFILCGRSCYEFLNSNLPLPSTSTICKFKIRLEFFYFVRFCLIIVNIVYSEMH